MKLYYVYYAIQKDGRPKVGASSYPKRRKTESKYQEFILLEAYDCPIKCGDREIELQLKYFGKRDALTHYAVWIQRLKTPKRTKEESNQLRKATFRKRQQEGRYVNDHKSFFQTEEYKRKMSESWKDVWENQREYMLNAIVNGVSKLTEEQVRYIRKAYFRVVNRFTAIPNGKMNAKQLADKFNCGNTAILNIVNGKTWKHVI